MKTYIQPDDIITVSGISLHIPDWTDNTPCLIIEPCIKYTESESTIESYFEEFLVNVCCNGYYEDDDLNYVDDAIHWFGKSLKSIKKRTQEALITGNPPYKAIVSSVSSLTVKIIKKKEGGLTFLWYEKVEGDKIFGVQCVSRPKFIQAVIDKLNSSPGKIDWNDVDKRMFSDNTLKTLCKNLDMEFGYVNKKGYLNLQ
jgi:hypothetical protein